jgi:exonuclease I
MKTFYWYDFETFGMDFANHSYLCKGLNENAKSLKIIV